MTMPGSAVVSRITSDDRATLRSALRAWRELVWISGGQLAGALGAIVAVRFMTAILDPPTYGELALGITAATFGYQLVMGPLVNAFERYYAPARETGHTDVFMRAARRLTAAASALIVFAALIVCVALGFSGH